ncbi:SHOCT domain-containing protein [Angustibacter sp. McL0619]|uniref:SHOCT domain-containing protein n=1 Tax=Angustibacter sp. McL0619 TaxID=3415676 RepID=UPI003CEF37B2
MPMSTMSANFGNGSVLLWMLEFFLFVIWFWLLITVFSDLFRDQETSGVAKAIWAIFVVVLPYLGVLIYLIARGGGMAERNAKQAQQMQAQMDSRIRAAAGSASGASSAEQITQAKSLLDSGAISQAEFEALKSKALAS